MGKSFVSELENGIKNFIDDFGEEKSTLVVRPYYDREGVLKHVKSRVENTDNDFKKEFWYKNINEKAEGTDYNDWIDGFQQTFPETEINHVGYVARDDVVGDVWKDVLMFSESIFLDLDEVELHLEVEEKGKKGWEFINYMNSADHADNLASFEDGMQIEYSFEGSSDELKKKYTDLVESFEEHIPDDQLKYVDSEDIGRIYD